MLSSRWLPPDESRDQPSAVRWGKIGLILLCLMVYGLVLAKIGFVLSTFLLVVALLKMIERKRWTVAVVCGAAVALGTYAVFELWLQARLPRGLLGILAGEQTAQGTRHRENFLGGLCFREPWAVSLEPSSLPGPPKADKDTPASCM